MEHGLSVSKTSAYRNWCFTLNNPETNMPVFPDFVSYAVWQLEKVDTPHLQGYVELEIGKRLSAMRKILPTAHWEPRRGTQLAAINYCTKSETRIEGPFYLGRPKEQGKRNDLLAVKRKIDAGYSEVEVADEFFEIWCANHKALRAYKKAKNEEESYSDLSDSSFYSPNVPEESKIL